MTKSCVRGWAATACVSAMLGLAAAWAAEPAAAAPPPAGPRIACLLITGDDVSAHNWKETSVALADVLGKSGRFDVTVVEGFGALDSKEGLARYGLILFAMYNSRNVPISDAAKVNLLEFVRSGKGLAISHMASASFPDWQAWNDLCGRWWVRGKSGHGPRGEFQSHLVDREHPITKGMDDFTANDELYAKMFGEGQIQALVTADSAFSKKNEPLVFVRNEGQGRVYHNLFGHDGAAVRSPAVARLWVRGCEWAATGAVKE